jgi:chromosome condensin MukBEF MukE localization factor
MSQDSIAEIKYLKMDITKYSHYEEFIVKGAAAIARFAAVFPAIRDIVLDGSHEEIDALDLESFYLCYTEDVEEALQTELAPGPDPWNT